MTRNEMQAIGLWNTFLGIFGNEHSVIFRKYALIFFFF